MTVRTLISEDMATQLVITRDLVYRMISLLDYCYRLGVEAAREVDDEGLAREFLGRTQQAGVYGLLSASPVYIGWKEWCLRLMSRARSMSWSGSMTRFFSCMGRFGANYLSVFLPISQAFYNRGVSDYYDAPNGADFALFQSRSRVWWTSKGLKSVKPRTWVDELQMVSFDLERRDAEVWGRESVYNAKKVALTSKQYEMFRRSVGLVIGNW